MQSATDYAPSSLRGISRRRRVFGRRPRGRSDSVQNKALWICHCRKCAHHHRGARPHRERYPSVHIGSAAWNAPGQGPPLRRRPSPRLFAEGSAPGATAAVELSRSLSIASEPACRDGWPLRSELISLLPRGACSLSPGGAGASGRGLCNHRGRGEVIAV